MSLGHCGYMRLIQQDKTMLLYTYCCYNINKTGWEIYSHLEDGEIWIPRESLVEPEVHYKMKKMPSGRKKLIEKRVRTNYYDTVNKLIEEKKILIKNASGTWKTYSNGIDIWAIKLIWDLFEKYQDTGEIPEKVGHYT